MAEWPCCHDPLRFSPLSLRFVPPPFQSESLYFFTRPGLGVVAPICRITTNTRLVRHAHSEKHGTMGALLVRDPRSLQHSTPATSSIFLLCRCGILWILISLTREKGSMRKAHLQISAVPMPILRIANSYRCPGERQRRHKAHLRFSAAPMLIFIDRKLTALSREASHNLVVIRPDP